MHDILPRKGCVQSHVHDLFQVWEISDDISLTMQDRDKVATKH